jgi:hypothetical protein
MLCALRTVPMRIVLLLLALLPCASADSWDDFTNNLATDLVGNAANALKRAVLTRDAAGTDTDAVWRASHQTISERIFVRMG